MKKILILSLTLFSLLSCSSDDKIYENSIIGTWKLTSHSDLTTLPDCMKQTTITFAEHGILSGEIYEPNGGNCDKNTLNATYEKETETLYTVILDNGNSNTQVDAELSTNKLIWIEKSPIKTRTLEFKKQ
ncbi:lipocalin-like domain-containing protein [Tenacibaculum maritimum]|uniref:lipocalin family protein n=1 Tax=Tenacibaculum maritimum TaxID=107401 RepID=UPI001330A5E7|nr:lipocalin family protein [Tenacibaculum maritimum]